MHCFCPTRNTYCETFKDVTLCWHRGAAKISTSYVDCILIISATSFWWIKILIKNSKHCRQKIPAAQSPPSSHAYGRKGRLDWYISLEQQFPELKSTYEVSEVSDRCMGAYWSRLMHCISAMQRDQFGVAAVWWCRGMFMTSSDWRRATQIVGPTTSHHLAWQL